MDNELIGFRPHMLKFARLQLRDEALAEDAVQDALTAALAGLGQFAQRAQLKTWVFGILKRKIVDIIRERSRSPNAAMAIEEMPESAFDDLFDENGHWLDSTQPSGWGDPEAAFSSQQFWKVLQLCMERLPERTAQAFTMREVLELEPEEICKELAISSTNYWVILHRARMALRLCLDDKWFNRETSNAEL
jgi:RNA polymerase sigma-70 factor (TIGR02943 family)